VKTLLTYLLGAALVGSILSSCNTDRKLQAERLAHQTTKAQHAELVAAAEQLRAQTETARRKAEQELRHAQEAHAQEVATLHLDLDRARARAAVESGRLRDAAATAVERARAQCADSTSAAVRETASDAIGVLADVLGRADERAGLLADLADRRYLAGRACEREYETLREALKRTDMARISKVLRSSEDGHGGQGLLFYCGGCKMAHKVNIGHGPGPRWGYNGNPEKPTFTPSVLVSWDQFEPSATLPEIREKIGSGEIVQAKVRKVCHSFVTDGRIQYLSDCTHELAGQTIDLPPFAWGEDDPDDETEV
jgi:hypothetical protein